MARRDNPGGGNRPTATPPITTNPDPLASNLNAGTASGPGAPLSGTSAVGGMNTGFEAQGQQNRGVAQDAKDQVRNLAEDAKRQTSEVASQAGDYVSGLVSRQKEQAAERLGGVAGALREVGNRLQEDNGGTGFGQYAMRAADQVDRVSQYLRDRDLNTFVRDTESFARRHPDVFLGGTFIAGLLLARFLKSSSSDRSFDGYEGGAYASFGNNDDYRRSRYDGRDDADPVNPSAYASYPGERYGRNAELGGPPEPFRSNDRPAPYGTTEGVEFPDRPEGG